MQFLSSMVNEVARVSILGKDTIRKKYHEIALGTGVALPLRRIEVEARVLQCLCEWNGGNIKTPKILDEGDGFLDLVDIGEKCMLDFLPLSELTIAPVLWQQLGSWLFRVEKAFTAISSNIFDGLIDVQQVCAEALRQRKYPNISIENLRPVSVSLGDVGVSNIIWKDNTFWLFDFEFCHLTLPGRDVGQLAAQLIALSEGSVAQATIDGYCLSGGSRQDVHFWINAFKDYYEGKYGQN